MVRALSYTALNFLSNFVVFEQVRIKTVCHLCGSLHVEYSIERGGEEVPRQNMTEIEYIMDR